MPTLVNLGGRIVPPEQASVSVLDRGFLYGDSIYEVARTYRGVPFALDRHLGRLWSSAAQLAMPMPARESLEEEVARTLHAAGNRESYIRIVITRGEGPFGLAPPAGAAPNLILIVKPLETPPESLYARGLHLALVRVRRNHPRALDPKAKTGNYLNSMLALAEARRSGADDAVLLDLDERVTESSTANVFFAKDGVIVTPPLSLGILAGVTRQIAIDEARAAGLIVREEPHGAGALAEADEVFVTSTLREVMPVTRLSLLEDQDPSPRDVGQGAGRGQPGPLAKRLRELLHARIEREIARGAREIDQAWRGPAHLRDDGAGEPR